MNKIIKTGIIALGLAGIVTGCHPKSEKENSKNKATVTMHGHNQSLTKLDSVGYVIFETQIPTRQDSVYRTRGVFYSNGTSDSVDIMVDCKDNNMIMLTKEDRLYMTKFNQE